MYPSGIISALELNNNVNDIYGNTWVNYNATPFSSTIKKYGSHSVGPFTTGQRLYSNFGSGKNIASYECYFYVPSTAKTSGVGVILTANPRTIEYDFATDRVRIYTDLYATVSRNTWYHIAVAYDLTNVYFYLDGILIDSRAVSIAYGITIGVGNYSGGGNSFDGYIDRVLCHSDVKTSFPTYPVGPYPSEVISALEMENNANDVYSYVTTTPYSVIYSADIKKYGAYSCGFFNSSAYIRTGSPSTFKAIQCHFYLTADSKTEDRIVSFSTTRGLALFDDSRQLYARWAGVNYLSGVNLDAGKWYRLNLDCTSAAVNIYIDGVLVITIPSVEALSNIYWGIGAGNETTYLNGYIDRALTLGDITGGSEVIWTPPSVISLTPTSYPTPGGVGVTITGEGFYTGATVTFGGTAASSVTVVSGQSITCIAPAHAAGVVDVVVTNADGQASTLTSGFEYLVPTVTAITPKTGNLYGGYTATLTGTNFLTGASIKFGTVFALDVVVLSSTSASCTVPLNTAGLVDVVFYNSDGVSGTLTAGFEYTELTLREPGKDSFLYLNGRDITDTQNAHIYTKHELNIITGYDFGFADVKFSLPMTDADVLLKKHGTDEIRVLDPVEREGETVADRTIFFGGISSKGLNYKKNRVEIVSRPFLKDLAKREATFAQTVALNPINLLNNIVAQYFPAYYTADGILGYKNAFSEMACFLNTNGELKNVMDEVLSICELFDIGIFLDKLRLRIFPAGFFPDSASDIEDRLSELPYLNERPNLLFDKVTIKYKNSVGSAEETATAGSGVLEKSFSAGDLYFEDVPAAMLAARKISITKTLYYETVFRGYALKEFRVGQYVQFRDYIFVLKSLRTSKNITECEAIGIKI